MLSGPAGAGGAAHVFVEELGSPEMTQEDARHLAQSLRMRPGEVVTAADGTGRWRTCRFTADEGRLEPAGEIEDEARRPPEITIGLALVKGDRPEWAVQKLTELGVDRVVLFDAGRSIVRWEPDKAARNVDRLRRIAREAAMQSRRVRLPVVEGVVPFDELVGGGSALIGGGVALADPEGVPLGLSTPVVLVGPEGGWTDQERGVGVPLVGLGPTVLRAETAALAAGVLLCALRNRWM